MQIKQENKCSVVKLRYKVFCIYYTCVVYIVSAWYVLLQLLVPHRKPSKIQNQKDKVALITGGGQGIGLETARQLINLGMTVIIVGIEKDQRKGVSSLKELSKDHVRFLNCDLSSLKSVLQLEQKFKKLNLPLHLLINNAGIMFSPYVETEEGHESHWVINYLSHFLLTHLLLKYLIQSSSPSSPSKIVNLGSCLHYPATINFEDIEGKLCYSAEAAYTQSKLAMVMFAISLAKYLKENDIPVLINSVHPAVAFSGLYKFVWWANWIPSLGNILLKSPALGSDTVVHVSVSSEVTEGGNYYENCQITEPSKEAKTILIQNKLWDLSCKQFGIKSFGKTNVLIPS